jgi:hypothetical protein
MAPDTGRHDADENAADRARVDYLAGDGQGELDVDDRAELDELRTLLADPTLWAEPPADMADSIVALIAAEAAIRAESPTMTTDLEEPVAYPFVGQPPARIQPAVEPGSAPTDSAPTGSVPAGAEPTDSGSPGSGPVDPSAPIDLAAARNAREPRNASQRSGRRRFTRPAFLIAAAAAVVAVALSAVLLLRDNPTQRRFDVALSATELAPGASGSAVMLKTDSGWQIQLDASGLPRLDGGQFYQAWLRNAAGVLVPIGSFNEGTNVTLWAGVSPQDFPGLSITKESADGDQSSSGQRVMVGTATEG